MDIFQLGNTCNLWFSFQTQCKAGYYSGYGIGYTEAKDEKAAAVWANAPEGKEAYRLARAGRIEALYRCDRPGWRIKNGACFAGTAQGRKHLRVEAALIW